MAKAYLGPARHAPELGRDGVVLRAGLLFHGHPLNLGRERTGRCCAAWWAAHDAGRVPIFEDDGHHAHVDIQGGPYGQETRPALTPEASSTANGTPEQSGAMRIEVAPGALLRTGVILGKDGDEPSEAVEGRHSFEPRALPAGWVCVPQRPLCAPGACVPGGVCARCKDAFCLRCGRHAWDRGAEAIGCGRRRTEDPSCPAPARARTRTTALRSATASTSGSCSIRTTSATPTSSPVIAPATSPTRTPPTTEILPTGEARGPAIACTYCRTQSYVGRKDGEGHDDGCKTAALIPPGLHAQRAEERRVLWCQVCDRQRTIDPIRWALWHTDDLWCPGCDLIAPHHAAPRADVLAERCLCGACRTRRKFNEDAAAAGLRRAA